MTTKFRDDELEEVELYSSSRERQAYDDQATLYAIILATEHPERAYARDAVTQQEYVQECNKILSQFRLTEKAALPKLNMSTPQFMELYQMDCPRATERLLNMGIPEPIRTATGQVADVAVTVAKTVENFITTMDAVKIETRFVDELQPLLSDLLDSLTKLPDIPDEFEPNNKVKTWLQKLNSMRAIDEISEEDSRQLSMDLDSAYVEFTRYLKRNS